MKFIWVGVELIYLWVNMENVKMMLWKLCRSNKMMKIYGLYSHEADFCYRNGRKQPIILKKACILIQIVRNWTKCLKIVCNHLKMIKKRQKKFKL